MPYKISKNVPLFPSKSKHVELLQTIELLAVGDSFTVPSNVNVRENIYAIGRRRKIKLSVRSIENDQLRVWRVS